MKYLSLKINFLLIGIFVTLSCEAPLFQIPSEEDTSPPLVTLVNPADKTIVQDTVNVQVFAQDNDGVSSVELFLNDSSVIILTETPYEWTWNTFEFGEDVDISITAKATDNTENANQTEPIKVTIDNYDNVNPYGTFLNPFTGQTVKGSISITVDAHDNEGIQSVKVFINDSLKFTGTESPYTFDWNTTGLEDDVTYAIYAILTDQSGNETVIGPVSVLVDNLEPVDDILPMGSITFPPAAATVSDTVVVQVVASDNIGVSFVQIYLDGILSIQDEEPPYEYEWDTQTASEDLYHVISVIVEDVSGNSNSLSPITVFVNNYEDIDVTPPAIVITEPAAGQTVSGQVNIRATATDDRGIDYVEFYINNIQVFTDTDYPFEYNWDTGNEIEDSEIALYAKTFDTSQNTAQTQPISVTIDNIDNIYPTGTIMNPYAGQTVGGIVSIQVSATDNVGIGNVSFSVDGSPIGSDNEYPYEYDWDTNGYSEDEDHVISVTISDLSNNEVQLQPIAVIVSNEPGSNEDNEPPVIALLYPVSGQTVTETVPVQVYANDNDGISSITLKIDNQVYGSDNDAPFEFDWSTFEFANGSSHVLQAEAEDLSGNTSLTQPIFVIIDNSYNQVPENVSLSVGADSISLTWSSVLDASVYRIYRDSSFIGETTELNYIDVDVQGGNPYCYQVTAVNNVGTEGEYSNEACGIPLLSPPADLTALIMENNISLNWTTVQNASDYILYRDGISIYFGNDVSFEDSNLDYGSIYYYSVSSVSGNGAEGPTSIPIPFTTHSQLEASTLSVGAGDSAAINLSWTSVADAESYRIYKNSTFFLELLELAYTDSVPSGENHCYKITAINEHGTEGPDSNEECATAN